MKGVIESAAKTASGKPVWRLSKTAGLEINFEFFQHPEESGVAKGRSSKR